MTKTYRVLRKKLKELESCLESVLALPPEELPAECQLHHFLDMAQRLSFLEKMLSAEKASSPGKPKHLEHMSRRLKELGKILSDWVDSLGLTYSGMDCEHVRYNHADVRSTCSCTESCLNGEGDASADGVNGLSSPQRCQELEGCYEEKEEEQEDEEEYKELPVVLFKANRENCSQVIVDEKEETTLNDGGAVAKLVDVKRSSSSASERERKSGGSNIVGVRMMCGAVVTGWLLGIVSAVVAGLSSGGLLFQCGSQQYGNFLTPT